MRLGPHTSRLAEALLWTAGLALVAVADPLLEPFARVCVFHHVGQLFDVTFCPGCGLGHAVGHLVRGNWSASFAAHPLALPAVLILGTHVVRLLTLPRAIR